MVQYNAYKVSRRLLSGHVLYEACGRRRLTKNLTRLHHVSTPLLLLAA